MFIAWNAYVSGANEEVAHGKFIFLHRPFLTWLLAAHFSLAHNGLHTFVGFVFLLWPVSEFMQFAL